MLDRVSHWIGELRPQAQSGFAYKTRCNPSITTDLHRVPARAYGVGVWPVEFELLNRELVPHSDSRLESPASAHVVAVHSRRSWSNRR